MAIKVERQLKRKGTSCFTPSSVPVWKSNTFRRDDKPVFKPKSESFVKPKSEDPPKPKTEPAQASQSRTRDIKCFKCLGRRHVASQCPNHRVMLMLENGDVESEGSDVGIEDEMPA